MDVATPPTTAGNTPATTGRSRRATGRRRTVATSLSHFVTTRKPDPAPATDDVSNDVLHHHSKNGIPPLSPSSPHSPASLTHRYLLEVIQQQQERIVALQTSLLYATEFSQRASHPFSFDDACVPEMDGADMQHLAWSSLPVSPSRSAETPTRALLRTPHRRHGSSSRVSSAHGSLPRSRAAANACFDSATAATAAAAVHRATSTTYSTPSTQGFVTDATPVRAVRANLLPPGAADGAHRRRGSRVSVAVSPLRQSALHLRLELRKASLSSRRGSTAASTPNSAPITHRIHTAAPRAESLDGDNNADNITVAEKHDEMEEEDEEKEEEEVVVVEESPLPDRGPPRRQSSPALAESSELESLRKKMEKLSAAHLRLRVRCARRACEWRDTTDGLRAMIGCVQTVLDDSRRDASMEIPQYAQSVLEYVVRQCSRTLHSVGGGAAPSSPGVPPPLAPQGDAVARSSSPGGRAPASPGIILHRLRDRWFI